MSDEMSQREGLGDEQRELFETHLVELMMEPNGDVILRSQDTDTEDEWADALSSFSSSTEDESALTDESRDVQNHGPDEDDEHKLDEAVGGVVETPPVAQTVTIETERTNEDRREPECPLCFTALDSVLVGIPHECSHKFCVQCVQKWTESSNTCPIDRHRFNALHVYCGDEFLDTLHVPEVQVDLAPPWEDDVTARRVYRPLWTPDWRLNPVRRRAERGGPGRRGAVGVTVRGPRMPWRVTRRYPSVTPRAAVPQINWAEIRATLPTHPGEPGPRADPVAPGEGRARDDAPREWPMREVARRKYQNAAVGRPEPIWVPPTANPLTYRYHARMQWARRVTLSLPLPSNALEARYRIQNPGGGAFPT